MIRYDGHLGGMALWAPPGHAYDLWRFCWLHVKARPSNIMRSNVIWCLAVLCSVFLWLQPAGPAVQPSWYFPFTWSNQRSWFPIRRKSSTLRATGIRQLQLVTPHGAGPWRWIVRKTPISAACRKLIFHTSGMAFTEAGHAFEITKLGLNRLFSAISGLSKS